MSLLAEHLTDEQMLDQVYGECDDPVAVRPATPSWSAT